MYTSHGWPHIFFNSGHPQSLLYIFTLQILSVSSFDTHNHFPGDTHILPNLLVEECGALLPVGALLHWLREVRHEIHRGNSVFPLIVKDHFYYRVYDLRIVVQFKPYKPVWFHFFKFKVPPATETTEQSQNQVRGASCLNSSWLYLPEKSNCSSSLTKHTYSLKYGTLCLYLYISLW